MNSGARIDWRIGAPASGRNRHAATALLVSLDDPMMAPLWSLAPTDRDQAEAAYAGASSRERFLERRALLRSLIAAHLQWPVEEIVAGYDEAGAPAVLWPRHGPWISVAGRDSLAAVAVSDRPVGIDIEPLDPAVEPVEAVLHRNEILALDHIDPAARALAFLRIWTMKEAYLKALRTGLKHDPSQIEIISEDTDFAAIRDAGQETRSVAQWSRAVIGAREVIAACVVMES